MQHPDLAADRAGEHVGASGLIDDQMLVTVDPLASHVQMTGVGGGLKDEPEQALASVRERWKGKDFQPPFRATVFGGRGSLDRWLRSEDAGPRGGPQGGDARREGHRVGVQPQGLRLRGAPAAQA